MKMIGSKILKSRIISTMKRILKTKRLVKTKRLCQHVHEDLKK